MDEEVDIPDTPRRRSSDGGIPDWAKLAATVAATTATMVLWATSTFISRSEMVNHMDQQTKDFVRITASQEKYSAAEHNTARNLYDISNRLTSMETKMEILINGLGTNGVPPSNGYKNGKH